MRVDVLLHKLCVLKSRSLAKEACDRGKVLVNDAAVKASHMVRPGDRVRLDLGARVLEFRILSIPGRNVARKDVPKYLESLFDHTPEP